MKQIISTLAIAYGLTLGPGTVRAAIPEHDPHTLIVKFAPSVDGKALARELESQKGSVPAGLFSARNAGVEAMVAAFPIPPRGLKRQNVYDSLEMGQYFLCILADTVDINESMSQLGSHADYSLVQYNYINDAYEVTVSPNDSLYTSKQWHYRIIKLPEAWNVTIGNNGLVPVSLTPGYRV